MVHKMRLTMAVMAGLFAGSALAAVSAEEAKQLGISGTKLTAFGAERAGNAEGTIPPWNPNGVPPPPGFDMKNHGGHMPLPYPGEKPLFTITAQNMAQYEDKLTRGDIGLLKKYPDFKIVVWPTHRDFRYPPWFMENSIKNATQCKLGDDGIWSNCLPGVPFPIPKTGLEAMWNHLLGFRFLRSAGTHKGFVVDSGGGVSLVGDNVYRSTQPIFYEENKDKFLMPDMVYWQYRQTANLPARQAGEQIIIIDRAKGRDNRRAWQYIPGQRRVKLAPDIGFDTPLTQGGSAGTFDEVDAFFGSPQKYDFKLLGKGEKYIPADDYSWTDPKVCGKFEKRVRKNFPNPDCVRYELRRVWMIEATLKQGQRNVFPKRYMYYDEDNSLKAGTLNDYDAAGNLWRVTWNASNNGYAIPNVAPEWTYGSPMSFTTMDLINGTWIVSGDNGDSDIGWALGNPPEGKVSDEFFTPEAAAAQGIR